MKDCNNKFVIIFTCEYKFLVFIYISEIETLLFRYELNVVYVLCV